MAPSHHFQTLSNPLLYLAYPIYWINLLQNLINSSLRILSTKKQSIFVQIYVCLYAQSLQSCHYAAPMELTALQAPPQCLSFPIQNTEWFYFISGALPIQGITALLLCLLLEVDSSLLYLRPL